MSDLAKAIRDAFHVYRYKHLIEPSGGSEGEASDARRFLEEVARELGLKPIDVKRIGASMAQKEKEQ